MPAFYHSTTRCIAAGFGPASLALVAPPGSAVSPARRTMSYPARCREGRKGQACSTKYPSRESPPRWTK